MYQVVRAVVIWSLIAVYSLLTIYKLLVIYITKFSTQPWKPKDRPNPPSCLVDPKYGTHQFVVINGVRLHYVEAGDRSKPIILFVHGFPEFWFSWRNQLTEFSKDYWVVAIDLRGYNLSERPDGLMNYDMQMMIDDIRALIEHFNRKQFILVCHDWGAIIGSEFVSQHPDMIHKYVLMGSASRPVFKKLFGSSFDQFKRSWYVLLFKVPILPELILSADDFNDISQVWANEEDREIYKYVLSRPGALSAAIDYYRANFSVCGAPEPVNFADSHLDGSNGMFMLGEFEKYMSKETIPAMAQAYPKLRIEVVPGASHFLQQDAAKATNELLHDFLGSASDYPIETFINSK